MNVTNEILSIHLFTWACLFSIQDSFGSNNASQKLSQGEHYFCIIFRFLPKQLCSGLHALCKCATVQMLYCKELTFQVLHKILNSLQTHVHALLILMSCLYHLLFLFSLLKSTKLQKKRKKKLDKNVIAKLSGNKVILLRK